MNSSGLLRRLLLACPFAFCFSNDPPPRQCDPCLFTWGLWLCNSSIRHSWWEWRLPMWEFKMVGEKGRAGEPAPHEQEGNLQLIAVWSVAVTQIYSFCIYNLKHVLTDINSFHWSYLILFVIPVSWEEERYNRDGREGPVLHIHHGCVCMFTYSFVRYLSTYFEFEF